MLKLSHQLRTLLPKSTMQLRSSTLRHASSGPSEESPTVIHNEQEKQFQYLGGHLAYETYRETVSNKEVSVLDLTHTFVPTSGRGKGIAKILCDEAFAFARKNDLAVRPSCSYLSDTYLVKNDPGTVQIV